MESHSVSETSTTTAKQRWMKPCGVCGVPYNFYGKSTVLKQVKGTLTCDYCNPNVFLPASVYPSIALKTELLMLFPGMQLHHNAQINGADKSRHRPQFMYDCKTHHLIVQCDNDQHKSYNKRREFERMKELASRATTLYAHPIVIVRYNPDSFKWNENVVDIDRTVRLNAARYFIKTCVDDPSWLFGASFKEVPCHVLYLFYDNKGDSEDPCFHRIVAMHITSSQRF